MAADAMYTLKIKRRTKINAAKRMIAKILRTSSSSEPQATINAIPKIMKITTAMRPTNPI